jgi:hypothetical protein
MSSFKSVNPTNFKHLGDNGFPRHFHELGTIINYAPLNPQQIIQALSETSSHDIKSPSFRGLYSSK